MCTACWSSGDGGYRLLFNRDERKARPKAYPPKAYEVDGVRMLAPKDPKAGGTWISVNEFGLTVAIFNNYGAIEGAPSIENPESRGTIPFLLGTAKDLGGAVERFEKLDKNRYPPFVVLLVGRDVEMRAFSWNGKEVDTVDLSGGVFTTSSFETVKVEAYRRKRFREMSVQGLALEAFLQDIDHSNTAYNPLMERAESMTHCMTEIEVGDGRASCVYRERIAGELRFGEAARSELSLADAK